MIRICRLARADWTGRTPSTASRSSVNWIHRLDRDRDMGRLFLCDGFQSGGNLSLGRRRELLDCGELPLPDSAQFPDFFRVFCSQVGRLAAIGLQVE